MRGRKPKPLHLHLVDGTRRTTRHGTERAVREAVAKASARAPFPKLTRPPHLSGDALTAWRRCIAPLGLDVSREPCALAFVELWAQFRADPKAFRPNKHAAMRAYWNRLLASRVTKPKVEADEHFGD
jgi:hypothetical protein